MHTILETLTKKNSLQNLTMFYGGLFELEILEIFTTVFFLKTIVWTWIVFKYCRVLSLKTKKKSCQRSWKPARKLADIARGRRKTLKKRKEKQRMAKNQTIATNIFFTFTFLYRKIYILLENILGKSLCFYIYITVFSDRSLLEMQ